MTAALAVYDVVDIARQFRYLRETQVNGQNHGLRINGVQVWSGGKDGDSYCCEIWWMWQDISCQGEFGIPRVQLCQDVYELAKKGELLILIDEPEVGCTYLFVDDSDHAHHIGIVTAISPALDGISGNTSEDGTSSNGNGVHEHELLVPRTHIRFLKRAV